MNKYKNTLLIVSSIILVLYVFKNSIANFFSGDNYFQESDTSNATITDSSARFFADKLHVAMGSIGTDFAAIDSVFSNFKNEHDYLKVYKFFGSRGYIDVIGVGTNVWSSFPANLNQWLSSELSKSEKKHINEKYSISF